MTIPLDSCSPAAALVENALLASLKTTYRPEDLNPEKDTEPHILGRVKGNFKVYSRLRSHGKCKLDLLVKIQQQLCMYRVVEPGFYSGPLLCVEHLQTAVAALREPKKPARKGA